MDQFKNPIESHNHSQDILKLLYEYDTFMDSISTVADMGCGSGLDIQWWATLTTRDDPPEPHNYKCFAVDKNIRQIESKILEASNIIPIQADFEAGRIIPVSIDLVWCHNSFQYALNPLGTLSHWNNMMNINGMLILSLPQHQTYQYNRIQTRSFSGCYYHYNICNMMYMLAVNGFDCRDCYMWMDMNTSWMHFAVYKSADPLDPASTSWFDLADKGLISDMAMHSLNKYGHVRQEELMFTWLDKDWRFAKN
jgi:SAM-dependent methyltransferase